MEKGLVEDLIKSRKAVKKKFQELQSHITHHENYLEKKLKPIADPIKELLRNIKHEKVADVKQEPLIKRETPTPLHSTPNTEGKSSISETPKSFRGRPRRLSFLQETILEDDDNVDDITAIDPDEEAKKLENSQIFQEYINPFGGKSKVYIGGLVSDTKGDYDYTYGPKVDIRETDQGEQYSTGKFLLGNSEISFSPDGETIYIITTDGIKHPYKGSAALYELIFKHVPTLSTVQRDLQAVKDYREILDRTSVHRFEFDPSKQLKGNSGRKYLEYIKPIVNKKFDEIGPQSESPNLQKSLRPRSRYKTGSKIGKGVLKLDERKIQFIPYKSADDLVERLKLLLGEKLAGNTSHENEIIYIIDELKNKKVIK